MSSESLWLSPRVSPLTNIANTIVFYNSSFKTTQPASLPMEYFDDHEFSYDMDTAQSEVKYDPRLLSQQLKNQRNHEQERAAPCYSATNKYTHGQRVAREDPCEVCLCVDGEKFCWWKKCGNIKRRKFKSEKSAKLGKLQRKAKTNEKIHKENQQQQQHLQQLHLKQKKKFDLKLKQQHQQQEQQHWQEQHNHHQQQLQRQHQAVRNKILTFPENLPSVLYYDYKTEDQHQHEHAVHHGNHMKLTASPSFLPTTSSTMAKTGGGGGGGSLFSVIGFAGAKSTSSNSRDEHDGVDDDNDDDDDDDDDTSLSAVGVAEPISTEVKSQLVVADESEAGIVKNSGQYTTVRIAATSTTTGTTAKSAPLSSAAGSTTEPFFNEHPKEDQSNTEIQYISGHPAGDIGQMLNKNMLSIRHRTELVNHNHMTTIASQSQEVDHDGILRDGPNDASNPLYHHPSSSFTEESIGSSNGIKQNNEQQRGGVAGIGTTSFRSSFNDFSSEFNASAAMDLALIISHHSAHNAPIILEADSIANASLSSLPKQELGGPNAQSTTNSNNLVLNSTTTIIVVTATPVAAAAPSTTVNPAQECIVMGASYKIGAILPQDTGNCLQCVCIEGTTADDTPRVTCSPHNCPPLVLPDLFDATGY